MARPTIVLLLEWKWNNPVHLAELAQLVALMQEAVLHLDNDQRLSESIAKANDENTDLV